MMTARNQNGRIEYHYSRPDPFPNGNTNAVGGLVERNGRFWVENLPLNSGVNQVSIIVSNVVGQTTVTNLSLMQSDLTLTMNVVSYEAQLWQPTVSMGGAISDPSYAVWGNGQPATVNGNDWSADNVPTTSGGVAIFDVTAYPPGEAPAGSGSGNGVNPQTANAVNTGTNSDKPVRLYVQESNMGVGYYYRMDTTGVDFPFQSKQIYYTSYGHHWEDGVGGIGKFTGDSTGSCSPSEDGWPYHDWANQPFQWPKSSWPDLVDGTYTLTGTNWMAFGELGYETNGVWRRPIAYDNVVDSLIAGEHCNFNLSWDTQYEGCGIVEHTHYNYRRSADTTWHLQTGGKAIPKKMNLWQLTASASAVAVQVALNPPQINCAAELVRDGWATSTPITNQDITIDGQPLGSDGKQWRLYADNTTNDVTPRVKNKDFYTFNVDKQKYEQYIQVSPGGRLDPDTIHATNCVGQKIVFSLQFDPPLPDGILITNQNNWWLPPDYANASKWFNAGFPPDGSGDWEITTCDPVKTWTDSGGYGVNPPYCTTYLQVQWPLTQPETGAWWIFGGAKVVGCLPTLSFNNGQMATVFARGRFNIYRPTIAKWNPTYLGTPQVTNMLGKLSLGADGKDLMTFEHYIQSDFSGTAGYTQLISGEYDSTISISTDGYEIDNSEWCRDRKKTIHSTGSWTQNEVSFDDSPSCSLGFSTTKMDLSFRTYLRFKPDAGNAADNIFVTLRLVTWGVTASATKTSGVWTVNPSSSAIGPSETNSTVFPVWGKVFNNL
jgi:hypothetical protein